MGEAVGTQSRGLSQDLISMLPVKKFKCGFFSRKKSRNERYHLSFLPVILSFFSVKLLLLRLVFMDLRCPTFYSLLQLLLLSRFLEMHYEEGNLILHINPIRSILDLLDEVERIDLG